MPYQPFDDPSVSFYTVDRFPHEIAATAQIPDDICLYKILVYQPFFNLLRSHISISSASFLAFLVGFLL